MNSSEAKGLTGKRAVAVRLGTTAMLVATVAIGLYVVGNLLVAFWADLGHHSSCSSRSCTSRFLVDNQPLILALFALNCLWLVLHETGVPALWRARTVLVAAMCYIGIYIAAGSLWYIVSPRTPAFEHESIDLLYQVGDFIAESYGLPLAFVLFLALWLVVRRRIGY